MSKGWYPQIATDLCIGCSICFEFCPHGVYEWDEQAEQPQVVQPDECIHGCHGCENQCPSQAITYYGDLPGRQNSGAYRLSL